MWRVVIYLLLILTAESLSDNRANLSFPLPPSVENYVKINDLQFKTLTAFSISYWFYDESPNKDSCSFVFSYACGSSNNAILIGRKNKYIIVKMANNKLSNTGTIISQSTWYFVAVTWSSNTGVYLYINGKLDASKNGFASNTVIESDGALVLGQDQDSIGGSFDQLQAFGGKLSKLNWLDEQLSSEDVMEMYNTETVNLSAAVLTWEEILNCPPHGQVMKEESPGNYRYCMT